MTQPLVSPAESPVTHEDNFTVGSVQGGADAVLAELRTRLLDLTLLNRLLNFKQTSPRVVRFVDELPDQLFSRLGDGDELEVVPVPLPPSNHALLAGAGASLGKDRQRAAEAYAAEVGIATSFDVPEPAEGKKPDAKHSDSAIQSLLFPSDLERSLTAIAADARTAVEEKGSEILYLVFGFLEWFESQDSPKSILAPLVMLPVKLRKGEPDRKTGAYRFYLSALEQDILSNISLQEKLRRDFGLTIPDLDDEELPEAYFERLAKTVPLPPRWQIRRQISLGLLSFSKLLMYRDLDPRNWPEGNGPADHPRLLELIGGAVAGEPSGDREYAHEYDFEKTIDAGGPPVVPPIVLDADSSQHSAIVDAMMGKNLVIEGPPGTGKSQTIANLIVAALGEGKSVLFVAEKQTALEVVHRRLEKLGLGQFCLELHSDKAQKSRVLDDVRRRRETRGTFRPPTQLDECIRVQRDARARLNDYANVLNRRVGQLGWTIHELLWGTQRRREKLGAHASTWDAIGFDGVENLALGGYEAFRAAASDFGTSLADVRRGEASLAAHPFWGVWPNDPRSDLAPDLLRHLEALERAVGEAEALRASLVERLGGDVPEDPTSLAAWLARLQFLGQAAQGAVVSSASALVQPVVREELAAWSRGLAAFRQRRAMIFARLPSPAALNALRAPTFEPFAFLRPEVRTDGVTHLVALTNDLATRLQRADGLVDAVARWLGESMLPRTLAVVAMLAELFDLARSAPFQVLAYRAPTTDAQLPLIDGAARRVAELRAERAALAQSFHLDLLPADPAVLERHAATCATTGALSFLSGDYREAKRVYALLSRVPARPADPQMADAFRALGAHVKKLRSFEESPELRRALGPAFQALETNFEAIHAARSWQARAESFAHRHAHISPRLVGLGMAHDARLRDLAVLASHADVEMPSLASHVDAVLRNRQDVRIDGATTVATALEALSQLRSAVVALVEVTKHVGPQAAPTVGVLRELRAEADALVSHASVLEAATLPGDVFGPAFRSVEAPLDVLERSVAFADALVAADTPAPLRDSLLRDASPAAFDGVGSGLQDLRTAVDAVRTAEANFSNTWGVRAADWYGMAGEAALRIVRERSARALEHRAHLAPWLAYLRARHALARAGGAAFLDIVEKSSAFEADHLRLAAELVVHSSLARRVFDAHPLLQNHDGITHDGVRAKFREYDVKIIDLERERLARRIDDRPVPEGIKSSSVKERTELALLDHELGKQRRHLPIRQLVNRAGGALRALKPCFMMSPRSVAQYLEGGRHEFDLVVMDEASQLRPEDALGAILRGKQVVIVGDSKQLPPTSFFSSSTDGDGEQEEEFVTENKESILDLARTTYRPVRQLRWHYRSRHGSLIAFSNKEYYGDNLVVFPSPKDATEDLGVKFVKVEDGLYADGVNEREAERVADAVIEHLRDRVAESFGVVALNIRQQQRIQHLLATKLKDEPELRKRFDEGGTDGPFVKNLESVQGDERDVIYISVTYGPSSPNGRVAKRFGPINQANGWRRLNVLFSRAKKRVVVFASFESSNLDASSTTTMARGAEDLRKYLEFARTGRLTHGQTSGRAPDSDFEVEVAEALQNAGYTVEPQVGVAGYFVDLAVRHPRTRAPSFSASSATAPRITRASPRAIGIDSVSRFSKDSAGAFIVFGRRIGSAIRAAKPSVFSRRSSRRWLTRRTSEAPRIASWLSRCTPNGHGSTLSQAGQCRGAWFCGLVACTSSSEPAASGETDTPIDARRPGAEAGGSAPPHATTDAGSKSSSPSPPASDDGATARTETADESPRADGDASSEPPPSSPPTSGDDAGSRADAGGGRSEVAQCNELVQRGSSVESLRTVGAGDGSLEGGTVLDGTYVLTQVTDDVEYPPGGTRTPYGGETLRIRGGELEELFTYPSGDVRRFDATLMIVGSHFQLVPTCTWSSNPANLPLLGDWAPTEHQSGSTYFAATEGTLTFSTPRGNHERLTLVYTKVAD
ncbi:DNA helicase related protein [Labilithrix luteola]|uniref:DNA helicase related protein n=1 Tax=Labilithrix luteola TaxID=1391654 RepID=A0A0K1QG77_9BACT|nr:DUF4011 domain-containing protein [Labilithrix luteola]AKV04713.1 DNA helicase related protein [Labilithrix luteola]